MTRSELMNLIGYKTLAPISSAITKIEDKVPSLKKKRQAGLHKEWDMTLEEVMAICKQLNLNELSLELVQENFIERTQRFVRNTSVYIDGTESFLERYGKDVRHIECCACCAFLARKTIKNSTSKRFPFCRFYKRYIFRIKVPYYNKERKMDIFKDKCPSWRRTENEILLFTKE